MQLKDNEQWADVVPVPQDDGPRPIVPISYSPEFIEHMDYFRAILKSKELSERALDLTAAVIELNSANYTAWSYRRDVLFHLNRDLEKELKWVEAVAEESPKNYQLWHHRRVLVDRLNKPLNELAHTAHILDGDAKNYHAWSHRQWVLGRFKLWENELDFCSKLLTEDLRNNSAWNQRNFVIKSTTGFTVSVIKKEFLYTWDVINKAVNNQSPWNYIYGMLISKEFDMHEDLELRTEELVKNNPDSCPARATLVELWSRWGGPANAVKAIQECKTLQDLDAIRKNYWAYREQALFDAMSAKN